MFLQKSFKKQQFTNLSLLVTVLAQFTTKTANWKKAIRIYILPLVSYSINKPKSRIVFTSKNLFSYFTCKKNFGPKNGGCGLGGGEGWGTLPPSVYGPEESALEKY